MSLSSSDAVPIFGQIVFAAKWLVCQFKRFMTKKILRQFDTDMRGYAYDIETRRCVTTENYCHTKNLKWCNKDGDYIDTIGRYKKKCYSATCPIGAPWAYSTNPIRCEGPKSKNVENLPTLKLVDLEDVNGYLKVLRK